MGGLTLLPALPLPDLKYTAAATTATTTTTTTISTTTTTKLEKLSTREVVLLFPSVTEPGSFA